MPLKRRRRRSRKYEWAIGVFLIVVGLWALGLRIHPESIPSLRAAQRVFWSLSQKDGSVLYGKIIFRTEDAVTLETQSGRVTVMQPEILKLEPLSHREVEKMREQGAIEIEANEPLLSWRKEDTIFHNLLGSDSQSSGKSSNPLEKAIFGQALKSLPAEGVGGVSKDKIMKAYSQGKIDSKAIQDKMKNMDPKIVEQYRKKAAAGSF